YAVVALLARIGAGIAGREQLRGREGLVGELGLLQRHDVGSRALEPAEQLRQAYAQRIDVPGGNPHAPASRPQAAAGRAMPCSSRSGPICGSRPREATKGASGSRLPPDERMQSRKRAAVDRSKGPGTRNAAKASAASTSAHL